MNKNLFVWHSVIKYVRDKILYFWLHFLISEYMFRKTSWLLKTQWVFLILLFFCLTQGTAAVTCNSSNMCACFLKLLFLVDLTSCIPIPAFLPALSQILPLSLQPPSLNKTNLKRKPKPKQNKTEEGGSIVIVAVVWHIRQFTLYSNHFYLSVFTTLSHWSGSGPLVSAVPSIMGSHWGSSCISSCFPESWRSCYFGFVG